MRVHHMAMSLAATALACVGGSPAIQSLAPLPGIPDSTLARAVASSSLIFAGRILTRDSLELSVLTNDVIRTTGDVGNFTGRTVVVVDSSGTGGTGDHAVFLTYGSRLGTSIRVRQVLRIPGTASVDLAAFRARLAHADSTIANAAWLDLADSADAVIVAMVDSVAPLSVPFPNAFYRSEHAPDWRSTVLSVTGVFRPRDRPLVGTRLRVLVAPESGTPGSAAATIAGGERRIWLVRKAYRLPASYRPGVDSVDTYFVLRPGELRFVSDSTRFARLLRSQ